MTDNPSILEKERDFMVVDFPKKVIHGGLGKRQREKTRKNVLDFSASTNPFPPQFVWHCPKEQISCYPDDTYTELKERIGKIFCRAPEEITVGNGSIELIRVFCSVILKKNSTFFIQSPTFGEYELSARLTGATWASQLHNADVFFVCNPNNPTGILQKKPAMRNILKEMTSQGGFLFCDEAFIGLADPEQSLSDVCDPHLFVLHSLTKSFSVPGIRFGFGFGDAGLIEKMETVRPPWSVNAFAEAYAMEALLHMEDLSVSRAAIGRERNWLVQKINTLGLQCHPSSVNYVLVECGRDVAALCDALARRNILVRNCASFGLPTSIRVAVRTRPENKELVEGLTLCVH